MSIHENSDVRVPVNSDSISINRDDHKCILCGNCRSTCKFVQGVYGYYDLEKTGDYAICIDCGQCTNVCPTGALLEVQDYLKVKRLVKDPNCIVIFQTAPAVRTSLGEEFGFEIGSFVQGKLVSALRKLGASYVFDTAYGADLTIMEEANELIFRLQNRGKLPMFTSCCPSWVKFAELFYPEYLSYLSTTKSPVLMLGAMIKTYFAQTMHIDPKKIVNVAVTPCTSKKVEIKRKEINGSSKFWQDQELSDIDFVITTRELARWLKEEQIDFATLDDSAYDSLLGEASGAGVIFGATGGVMEAAIRTAHYYLTGERFPLENLSFEEVRGLEGIKETTVKLGKHTLSLAVITGTNHVRPFLEKLKHGDKHYDFIEVMACLGGCVAGGGQPKIDQTKIEREKEKRARSLYLKDLSLKKRCSYENEEIKSLYRTFLTEPGSELCETLLHTTYHSKADLLEKQTVSSELNPKSWTVYK